MTKIDLMPFLMIDGSGDPNVAPEYVAAVEALYGLAYALKFEVKRASGQDYTVMPLEGLWWVDDMRQFSVRDKAAWKWTMLIISLFMPGWSFAWAGRTAAEASSPATD